MAPPGGPAPAIPQGWQANWSDQYNEWFYIDQTTGASQWEYPAASQRAPSPQPSYHPSPQPQYSQQGFAPSPAAAQPAVPAKAGIMGKLSNLDPKAQTALAVGGGMVAGAFLEHEVEEFSDRPHFSHHAEHHFGLGSMAALIGSAGAGALGAKFFGRKGQAGQTAPQAYPAQGPPPPGYPGQSLPPGNPNSGPGFGGLGKFAAGGAAGMAGAFAVNEASNLLHHHHRQDQAGAPTAIGGGGGMGSFLGGLAYSGPRLTIHAASYADKDVTDRVRALVSPEQVLAFKSMNDEFGDPWPEAERKSFSVLYQYGDRPLEVWAGSTSNGEVDVKHEALANVRMAYINKSPGRIISLIWGQENILSLERVEKLEKDGEIDCRELGNGGFFNWQVRNLVCYYRAPHGGIGIAAAREGGTLRLPWNPLAKWS